MCQVHNTTHIFGYAVNRPQFQVCQYLLFDISLIMIDHSMFKTIGLQKCDLFNVWMCGLNSGNSEPQQQLQGGVMYRLVLIIVTVMSLSPIAEGRNFALSLITNEASFFKNTTDNFNSIGQTLQIVSINSFKTFTWFNFEFTGDFNWDMTEGKDYDYYIELSLVKNVTRHLSINYQRIYGTFVSEPVNQFGLRLSL